MALVVTRNIITRHIVAHLTRFDATLLPMLQRTKRFVVQTERFVAFPYSELTITVELKAHQQRRLPMLKTIPEYSGQVLAFCGGNRALAIANLENSAFIGARQFVADCVEYLLIGE